VQDGNAVLYPNATEWNEPVRSKTLQVIRLYDVQTHTSVRTVRRMSQPDQGRHPEEFHTPSNACKLKCGLQSGTACEIAMIGRPHSRIHRRRPHLHVAGPDLCDDWKATFAQQQLRVDVLGGSPHARTCQAFLMLRIAVWCISIASPAAAFLLHQATACHSLSRIPKPLCLRSHRAS
jgi:hypothetical protein